MKTIIGAFFFTVCFLAFQNSGFAQTNCGPTTPTFTVDLTGRPIGSWVSPVIQRSDTCCGAIAPDACVQFVINLDTGAQGIVFDIFSGSIPPGAMFY